MDIFAKSRSLKKKEVADGLEFHAGVTRFMPVPSPFHDHARTAQKDHPFQAALKAFAEAIAVSE